MKNLHKIDLSVLEKFLEATKDLVLVTNNKGDIISYNDNAPSILELDATKLYQKNIFDLLTTRAKQDNRNKIEDFINKKSSMSDTAEVLCGNGLIKYFDMTAVFLEDNIIISAKNVTDRISIQVELETLSYKDSLTGLYNRNYFVEVIPSFKSVKNLPLSITVLDINDLKLINDAFGHSVGDKTIVEVAQIIKNNIPSRSYAMRIGGDEFVVIMPNSSDDEINNMKNNILATLSNKKINSVHVSVALGTYNIKTIGGFDNGYNIADTRMYRQKQLIKHEYRLGILNDIMEHLFDISPIDKKISEGVKNACIVIGKQLGFKPEKINQLSLLGYYHNIGKIILDESLLNRLDINDDEKEDYMMFANKSYSLFSSSKELFSLARDAELVFENYDASGISQSLANEDIPMFARILKIAIAINRLEIKGESRQEILLYLQKYKGTKYDPYLVDVASGLV